MTGQYERELDKPGHVPGEYVGPHPGEQHQFRTTCRLCGEPGFLHISLIAPDETVTIAPLPASRGNHDDLRSPNT